MTNQLLAVYQDFETTQKTAVALFKSGYFSDVKSEQQAIVKIIAGQELGLPAFASMAGIHIIQGKPVLGANVIATLVKNSGRSNYKVVKCDNESCVLEWYENGASVGQSAFTMAEAKNAGLTGKDNWNKYPSDMLFARAISRGARRFAPGIFGGAPVYTPDEMGMETDEDGYVDSTFKEVTTPTNGNGHKPLIQAIQDEGGVPVTQPEGDKPEYKGKTAKLHQHTYPLSWTSKLIQTFVTPGKLNVPHLDGILQKLNLSFDTDIDTVISAVNDYAKENAQN